MSWKKRVTLGEQIVADAFDSLSPPVEWLLNQADGFTWWPGELAQRVWTDEGVFFNSRTFYRLHAEIDLVRAKGQKAQLDAVLETEMDQCIFSSLLYDKRTDTYRLHASVYAESEVVGWIGDIFQAAARLQVTDAFRILDSLSATLHPSLAVSTHPVSGERGDRDPRMESALCPIVAAGSAPSAWSRCDEWRDVDWAMERQASAWAKSDRESSTSTFYWAPSPEESIGLFITSTEPHPILGDGLHFTLSVPLRMSAQHVAYMALELNDHERNNWLKTHMLGSWCNHQGGLAFRLFVPNAFYREGVLHELAVAMAGRANWVNEYFFAKKQAAEAAKQSGAQ